MQVCRWFEKRKVDVKRSLNAVSSETRTSDLGRALLQSELFGVALSHLVLLHLRVKVAKINYAAISQSLR